MVSLALPRVYTTWDTFEARHVAPLYHALVGLGAAYPELESLVAAHVQ